MKKALLLALVGLFAAVAPALAYPPAPANVNFSSERGVPFGLVLDGRVLTRGVARQVHVDQLVPGAHWADFTVPTSYGGSVRFRSRVWLEPGVETSFVLIARPGRPLGLRQVNAVALYGPGRGYGPRHGGGYYNSPTPYGQGGYGQGNYSPNGSAPAYPQNGGYQSNGNNQGDDYDDDGYGSGNNGSNGTGNNGGGAGYYPGSATSSYRTLPPQEVNNLVQTVRQQNFESGKLSTAKAALERAALQTDDLKRLLLTMDFEASRLELAKFAYPRLTDPQNVTQLYSAFNFEASKREIEQTVRATEQEPR